LVGFCAAVGGGDGDWALPGIGLSLNLKKYAVQFFEQCRIRRVGIFPPQKTLYAVCWKPRRRSNFWYPVNMDERGEK